MAHVSVCRSPALYTRITMWSSPGRGYKKKRRINDGREQYAQVIIMFVKKKNNENHFVRYKILGPVLCTDRRRSRWGVLHTEFSPHYKFNRTNVQVVLLHELSACVRNPPKQMAGDALNPTRFAGIDC